MRAKSNKKKLWTENEVEKLVNTIMDVHFEQVRDLEDEIDKLQRLVDFYNPSHYADGC